MPTQEAAVSISLELVVLIDKNESLFRYRIVKERNCGFRQALCPISCLA